MNFFSKNTTLSIICGLGVIGMSSAAHAAAEQKISVSAPNAQELVMNIAKAHPEISLIGLHADVPNQKKNAIIACNDPQRVGKVSSEHDLSVVGKPFFAVARLDKKSVYEIMLPMSDASGKSFGMVVEQLPLTAATNEVDALDKALKARNELQAGINSQEWLFQSK